MALTETGIKALKPYAKIYKKSDAKGLFLEITPTGGKHWRYRYRYAGKDKRIALGSFPEISLAEARERRDRAAKQLANGTDPARTRRLLKQEAKVAVGNTFETVAADYIKTKYVNEGRAKATIDKQHFFLSHLKAAIGSVPIAEIKAVEIMAALRSLEKKGHRQTAKCSRAFASRVFRYGIGIGKCADDPARLLSGNLSSPIIKHRAAILDTKQLGEFLRSAYTYQGRGVVRIAAMLLPHLMLRPGELRLGQWLEINWDDAIWHVPSDRTKLRRPHDVPLSRQALAMLRELENLTGGLDWMFHGQGSKGPISENTLNQAYRRMGFAGSELTAHGFRTTASTFLNETGKWQPDAIERALAHGASNAVRGIYNRGTYWQERVPMMQWWSDYLDVQREGAVVLPFTSEKLSR